MTAIATMQELQFAINALIPLMLDKGLIRPTATAHVEANASGEVMLTWYWREPLPNEPWDDKNYSTRGFFAHNDRGDGLEAWEGALLDARDTIERLPNKPDREREEFLKLLARTTEYGRKVGIEDEFVNPLQVLAKKLSENALEAPSDFIRLNVGPEAQEGLDSPVSFVDDEIPF